MSDRNDRASGECRVCKHDVAFHASATQGRRNLPCEYPSCDCEDFTEPTPTPQPPPLVMGQEVWVRAKIVEPYMADCVDVELLDTHSWRRDDEGRILFGVYLSALRRGEE